MAETILDPNNVIDNEELLRDSLEIGVEECDSFNSISASRTNEAELQVHSAHDASSPNGLAKFSGIVEKEQKPRDDVKKQATKPKTKNIIELNKMNLTKGQPKYSYSNMHRKKLGRTAPIEKRGGNKVSQETSGPRDAAIELRKQLVLDGILTEKDELNNFGKCEKITPYCGVEETNQVFSPHTLEKNDYILESTRSNETNNISLCDEEYFLEASNMSNNVYPQGINLTDGYKYIHSTNGVVHGAVSLAQLPPVRPYLTSVQSAPADMQAYQDPYYERSCRSNSLRTLKPGQTYVDLNNSMSSLTSTRSASEQGDSMTYSGIYASTKQNARSNYKPYTLGDYKRLKKKSKPGGLGPDTKSEEHQHKAKKAIRQKEYSMAVKQRNTSDHENYQQDSKKKRKATIKEIPVHCQKQVANARRIKAMEYAKAIPKPVTSKNQNVWRSPSKTEEEPRTMLDILQRRHEDEKKAIDAMRRDLQAKLKTR